MQANSPATTPPREEDPVQEWDDGACLERAVARLVAERREVRELHGLRRCITSCTGLTFLVLGLLTVMSFVPPLEPLMIAGMLGLLRGGLVQGIDRDIDHHSRLAAVRQQELQARLESTEWLLV